MTDKVKLLILLSNWYSGATLFTILLNCHTQIISNGETFPFDFYDDSTYVCSCGEPLIRCEFYRHATSHMLNYDTPTWDRELFVQLPRYSKINIINSWLKSVRHFHKIRDLAISSIPQYHVINRKFVDAQLEFFSKSIKIKKASIYMDGMKTVRRAEIFSNEKKCQLKVVHLVRDGRGFCNSYSNITKRSISYGAKIWLRYIKMVDEYSLRNPNIPILTVRYEDICNNLKGTMTFICDFLGIAYEERLLGKNLSVFHVLGNRMRMDFKGEIRADLRWKKELSEREIDEITRIMRGELVRFGYM